MIFGTSILIVDDDAEVRKMLSSVLANEGYSVETAENGKQAVTACAKSPFDVALIDIEMPDMKGTELLNMLKQKQPKMVKIIVTGFPSLENAIKAVNEGADGYLLKPFDVRDLLDMIRKRLEEKRADNVHTWIDRFDQERERSRLLEQLKQ